jgi:TM2 domain-containing membrane protein YozV
MKNKWVAYVLLFGFPLFAAHRFYLGQWKKAILLLFMIFLPFIIGDFLGLSGLKIPWLSQEGYMYGTIIYWLALFVREIIIIPKIVEMKNDRISL